MQDAYSISIFMFKDQVPFWVEENRPGWWPEDLPFVSPNQRKGKEQGLYVIITIPYETSI